MTQIDYKKVFSKLSHIMALSHDKKFDQIVQNLITHTLNQQTEKLIKNETDVANRIAELYGITIRPNVILSNLDKLIDQGQVLKDRSSKNYLISAEISTKLNARIDEANKLENNVRDHWFLELERVDPGMSNEMKKTLWTCLKTYLSLVFEQHGIQTLHLLNPSAKINEDDQKSLYSILETILKSGDYSFSKEFLSSAINNFINYADETRTTYISQLADSTFTSFALTSDAETVNFLNQRYNHLQLFLDTNFIFGVLNLHKNGEDTSAREILEEVKRNRLPFRLGYHPETLLEFRRAFDSKALHLQASRWSRETSRIALLVDGLSPLEELFHKENVENEIDPSVFLDKYDHVDMILKDLGLIEFVPHRVNNEDEMFEVEKDVDAYKDFYDTLPNRKPKTYLNFKHDIIALREVRALNPKKTKFLDSNAFFVSSDYILGKFEKKYYKKNWEIKYVVSPSTFLQLIRPFVENDYQSNKRFIDNFAIPEFRSFEIDYSTTRSKALQILNDNYHDTSFETKVKILRDQVLLEKLEQANEDFEKQVDLIENQIALQNRILTDEKNRAIESIREIEVEKEKIVLERDKVEQDRITAINEIILKEQKLETANDEILKLKELHAYNNLSQQIEHKNGLISLLDDAINSNSKREIPILKVIDDRFKLRRWGLLSIVILYFVVNIALILKFSWEVMEPVTYILTLTSVLLGYGYLAIKGDSFDPSKYFSYVKRSITSQVYREFEFDLADFQLQKEKRKALADEVHQLKENLKTIGINSEATL